MMTEKLLTTGQACEILNVSRWTLKKWDESGKLPCIRTQGGHRRWRQSDINRLMGIQHQSTANKNETAIYCRVSSHDQKQKGDLDRQKARTLEHCLRQKYSVNPDYIFTEVGSGMNDNRAKLKRLFHLVRSKLIDRVVVEHKDRLTRFNYNYLDSYFSSHGVVIEFIEEVLPKTYEAELVEDVMSLMASLSAKIYGKLGSHSAVNN